MAIGRNYGSSHIRGFTLVELMVVLSVTAIALTLAVPNFRSFVQDNRLTSEANQLVTSLQLARSESSKRRVPVTICGSASGVSCDTSNWEHGWLVFTDLDADGAVDVGADVVLQRGNPIKGKTTLRATLFNNSGNIRYRPRGDIDSAGSFVFCDERGAEYARAVNINRVGRPRIATDDDNDAVVNDVSGGGISCS